MELFKLPKKDLVRIFRVILSVVKSIERPAILVASIFAIFPLFQWYNERDEREIDRQANLVTSLASCLHVENEWFRIEVLKQEAWSDIGDDLDYERMASEIEDLENTFDLDGLMRDRKKEWRRPSARLAANRILEEEMSEAVNWGIGGVLGVVGETYSICIALAHSIRRAKENELFEQTLQSPENTLRRNAD